MDGAVRLGNGPFWDEAHPHQVVIHPTRLLVFSSTADARLTSLAPAWETLCGAPPATLLGHGWLERLHPDDREPLLDVWQQARQVQQPFRQHVRLRDRHGRFLRMVIDVAPTQPTGDAVAPWLGCLLDAGPLPYSPLEMDLAEDRITDLLRDAWLPAVVLDLEGRILFLNEALAQLVGQADHELIYRDFFATEGHDVPPGDSFDPRRTPVAEYPPCFATRLRRRDGERRIVDWHAMSLRTPCGKIKGVALIGEDNTEERHNEERLRATHRVFETTSQAMLITDGQCHILSVNQAFTRLTGYAADEATGQNPRILQSGHHDAAFYAQMWQTLSDTGHWQGDIWDRRKDGSVYPKFLSISAIRNARGEVSLYSGIFYDITERKAIEETLDRLSNHVEDHPAQAHGRNEQPFSTPPNQP